MIVSSQNVHLHFSSLLQAVAIPLHIISMVVDITDLAALHKHNCTY